MHVLFTGLVYTEVLTGGDQLFLDIAPLLPKELKIVVITPHFAKKHWDKVKQPNIELRLLPPNRFEFKSNPLAIFATYVARSWQVYRILKSERVETIYSSSDIAYADVWPAYFLRRSKPNIKWISRIYHVLLPPKRRQGNYLVNVVAFKLQRLSFWMMKRRSTTVFALNKKLYDEVLELGFPKKTLSILGAGIDFKGISALKPTKRYKYDIAVLGRIVPVKGIFDTVKIWEKVHAVNPKLQLAWIGGGGDHYTNKLKNQLEDKKLSDTFHLQGFIDKDEVYSILKSAKIFLCPDHENGWGLAVCEAMSSGLPVISYDLDIFGGVYTKGFVSVPLFDTDSFANEIIKLIKNQAIRKKMARDALAQAKEFDQQKVIKELVRTLA